MHRARLEATNGSRPSGPERKLDFGCVGLEAALHHHVAVILSGADFDVALLDHIVVSDNEDVLAPEVDGDAFLVGLMSLNG